MSNVRSTWVAMSGPSRLIAVLGLVTAMAVVMVAVALVARPAVSYLAGSAPVRPPTAVDPPALPPTPSPRANTTPIPTLIPSPTPRGADPLLGTDGRLTVLLLGSDYRASKPGNRTDAIMVVSVDPTTGRSAGFSVPRDTTRFPLPEKGTYAPKVNALLMHLERTTPDAYQAMKAAVSRAFDLEVDAYVFIGFGGVRQLVTAVGGVDVTLEKAYYDPYYWVTSKIQGWGLPAGTSHLNGDQALIFARSRKGDNDFERARRQQLLVMAALNKVRTAGAGTLPELIEVASRTVRTDLPLDRAIDLFGLFSTVELDTVERAVFGPRRYATGTAGGSFELKLDVCRKWVVDHFPPIRPLGAWPEASAVPSASPLPSVVPEPAPSASREAAPTPSASAAG